MCSEPVNMGLENNAAKIEVMLTGDFPGLPMLTTSSGLIKQVDDFKYIGCWKDSKDFLVRRALASNAAKCMWQVWRSDISKSLKVRLFCATVESVLLYGSEISV